MNIHKLAEWADTDPIECVYDPDVLGLHDGKGWLSKEQQAEFYEWCGFPMYTLSWEVISVHKAYDLLHQGRHWILFPEDILEAGEFSHFSGYCPLKSECEEVEAELDTLTTTEALRVWAVKGGKL